MQLPLAYLDAAVIEEVPVEVWKDVFDAAEWPRLLTAKRDSLSHEDILPALQDDISDNLLHAIETLHTLGTETGREAIITAMNDQRVPIDALPVNSGEREFALRLYLAQRDDASLADVFARAQTQIQEGGDHRRYNEFIGKEARRPKKNLKSTKDQLRPDILQYCKRADLGDHVQVRAFEDDGAMVFSILRSDRTRKPLAIIRGRDARATIEYRPVHGDLVRYEPSIGRLRIAVRSASIVEFYRTAFGKVLFNDEFFFSGEPAYSLRVLQERGRVALENHRVYGVGRIWMTECLWERGDRNLLQIRSSDCFRTIEELGLPLGEGQLLCAKLKVQVIGKSTRPVTVNIRIPSRIEVSQRIHEEVIERVLKDIGIRPTVQAGPGASLWSLHPWRHPQTEWRTLFGAEMDRLVRTGVLAPIQLDTVKHPEHPESGRVLRATEITDGEFYGLSDAPEIGSRSLSATDLDGLELRPEAFRVVLRARLGITKGGVAWDGQDLLHLGLIEIGDQRIYAAYALRQPAPGHGERIRAHGNGASAVLLMPPGTTDDSELAKVPLNMVVPVRSQAIRAVIDACGLTNSAAAIHSAPETARLVVDTLLRKVWVDQIELENLVTDSHAFRFIELMAKSSGPISLDKISDQLSAGRQDGNTSARQAKSRAKTIIAAAMRKAGRDAGEDLFPSAGIGCYRCAVRSHVR